MSLYRVRAGARLGHGGVILEEGATLELPRHVASDPSVRGALQEVASDGSLTDPTPPDDLDRFRAHERVGILRERKTTLLAQIADIDAQIAREEDAVRAALPPPAAAPARTKASAPDAGATKE